MRDDQRHLVRIWLQFTGIGLLVGLGYTFTMSMFPIRKLDLNLLKPLPDSRPVPPQPTHTDRSPSSSDPSEPSEPADAADALPKRSLPPGCSVPPGGGPPVTSNFQPC